MPTRFEKRRGGQLISPQDFASEIRALPVLGDEQDCLIYFNNTKPASIYGGTWQELPQGTFLEAAGSNGSAGTSKAAGLPNIKGSFDLIYTFSDKHSGEGAMYIVGGYDTANGPATNGNNNYAMRVGIDASKSSTIYKDTVATVQPKSITVHIWRKVS